MQAKAATTRSGSTRRQVVAAAGASALALTIGGGLSRRPMVAAGSVFEDRNQTGRRGRNDPGIAGVMVSNGRNVVRTDGDGRWRLPVADGDSLFVIKPPHWATAIGPGGLPQFSYLHQPDGSPKQTHYFHAGIAATGNLPASIDFPLRRQDEGRNFSALLLADTQPANDQELAYLRDDIIAGIPASGAAFAINHGDVVFDDLALYARYLQIIGATGIPWHHCPGNHDINWDAPSDRWSRETWKRVFGPRHYAFQHAETTFILLDNVYYFGHNPASAQAGKYVGRIGDEQLQFVRNVLANVSHEQLVVVSMHIPLATYQDPASPADNTADSAALLELLAGRPHAVSFSGHMHLTEHHYLGPRAHHHHVLAAASGGWWGGPPDRRGIPLVCADEIGACELIVNVFDGGPRTRVSYEIAGQRPSKPMQRIAMADPLVDELFARQPELQRPWVKAVPSSHTWAAPLPPSLQPGAHRLTVRATDEYGREILTSLMLEVTAQGKATAPA